jgi:hypothetical protein
MFKTPEDYIVMAALIMVLPGKCLLLASYRQINFPTRMVATTVYQLGSIAAIGWYTLKYSWPTFWHSLMIARRDLGWYGWVVNIVLGLALVSPIITTLIVRDTLRHPYRYVRTNYGKFLRPA